MAGINDSETVASKNEQFHFFWQRDSVFSQWYPSKFTVDNITYNCAEQYMMYQKAVLFNDHENANKIIKSKDPRTQKSLGRKVRNFNGDVWKQNCVDIVKRANMAKFTQNKDLKDEMLKTFPKILVEASPYDDIWGIGLREDSPLAWNRDTWCGQNLLGFALTSVRDEIFKLNLKS